MTSKHALINNLLYDYWETIAVEFGLVQNVFFTPIRKTKLQLLEDLKRILSGLQFLIHVDT